MSHLESLSISSSLDATKRGEAFASKLRTKKKEGILKSKRQELDKRLKSTVNSPEQKQVQVNQTE